MTHHDWHVKLDKHENILSKGEVIIYDRVGAMQIKFYCKPLEGGQNFSA